MSERNLSLTNNCVGYEFSRVRARAQSRDVRSTFHLTGLRVDPKPVDGHRRFGTTFSPARSVRLTRGKRRGPLQDAMRRRRRSFETRARSRRTRGLRPPAGRPFIDRPRARVARSYRLPPRRQVRRSIVRRARTERFASAVTAGPPLPSYHRRRAPPPRRRRRYRRRRAAERFAPAATAELGPFTPYRRRYHQCPNRGGGRTELPSWFLFPSLTYPFLYFRFARERGRYVRYVNH